MPPAANPRKRPAPDSSQTLQAQQMNQSFTGAPSQGPNDQFLKWDPGAVDGMNYADPSAFNMAYGANQQSNPQFQQSMMPQTQLARRPMNRQLVATGQRQAYDQLNDPWGQFGDDAGLDPSNINGAMDEHESIEKLEEKAAVAKREAQAKRKQIPPFVQKLSSFLEENKNTDLIRWSDKGDSFIVLDEDEFAKTLIPELFKHNNYASFVRQLNMYGFHKRVGLSDNSMKASERKNKSPSEYYNPYFRRNHPNLLWLINKPKGGTSQKKGKGPRAKAEDGEDSDEDIRDADETYGATYGQNQAPGAPPAITAPPTSGPLQRREMAIVQTQLQEIQKQQNAISTAIARLRKDHNQLYQQAIAFQTLHDRHESSINAILTFLATVYNRSLDGQGVPNIAQMFSNAIPQDQQQQQGSVVDMGDVNNQQQQDGNVSPHRRAQRLLMAPPPMNKQQSAASTPSPAASGGMYSSGSSQMGQYRQSIPQTGSVEEVLESPSAETPRIKTEPDTTPNSARPQQNIMSLINNTNAQVGRSGSNVGMKFPDVLSHYENINGNSPLTSEQRNDMLNMIASNVPAGTNNALVSPTPPPQPHLEQIDYTQSELDDLYRMQKEQEAKIADVSSYIQPLSPSGSIPGLDTNQYFNPGNISPLSGNNIDLDQFLDSGAYYNNGDGNDYNFDSYDNNAMGSGAGAPYDFGGDGTADGSGGLDGGARIVETTGSSEGATPDDAIEEQTSGQKSPSKRRRKG